MRDQSDDEGAKAAKDRRHGGQGLKARIQNGEAEHEQECGKSKTNEARRGAPDAAELEADKCGGLHCRCAGDCLAKSDPASKRVLVQPVLVLHGHLANE